MFHWPDLRVFGELSNITLGALTVVPRRLDVVQRRVGEQVLELRLVVGAAVVRHPRVPDRELLEAQHVQHPARGRRGFQFILSFTHSMCYNTRLHVCINVIWNGV